jgi:hypothetical protein
MRPDRTHKRVNFPMADIHLKSETLEDDAKDDHGGRFKLHLVMCANFKF